MKEVWVYTTKTCPHCHSAKHALTQAGIHYAEKDVTTDQSAQQEMQAHQLMGVPAFKIDDDMFTGLDLNRIKRLIDYVVMPCPNCQKRMRLPKGKDKLKVTCPSCQHAFTVAPKA